MLKKVLSMSAMALATIAVLSSSAASAAPVYFNGFETDTAGWSAPSGYGFINRQPSGSPVSSSGAYHATVGQSEPGAGPYTNFGGYSSVFGNGFTASIDVYFDPDNWAPGTGFDYSVAVNNTAGGHLRDFIFHAGVQADGRLLVGGSNNTNFNTRMDLAGLANYFRVVDTGWYTIEHSAYDNGGQLAVDIVLKQGNTVLFTETRSTSADMIGGVGGNRYGWFTHTDNIKALAIDNASLSSNSVPEPMSMTLLGLGLIGAGLARRRQRVS